MVHECARKSCLEITEYSKKVNLFSKKVRIDEK